MKTIYLARHAKSSWNMNLALNLTKDFDRPLNKRGESDAVKMGDEMKNRLWQPEIIIASTAQRVKQTCDAYCESLDYPIAEIEWNADIYEAYTMTLIQILTNIDEGFNSVMLIGHNPAMENVLEQLAGRQKAKEFQQADGKLFTTANIAKLTFDGAWKDLVSSQVHLNELLRPKGIITI